MPEDVEDDVLPASLAVVERDVVFDANLVQHVKHRHLARVRARTGDAAASVVAEVAFFIVTTDVLDLELIRHFFHLVSSGVKNRLPVFLSEAGEEAFELLLLVIQLEQFV